MFKIRVVITMSIIFQVTVVVHRSGATDCKTAEKSHEIEIGYVRIT